MAIKRLYDTIVGATVRANQLMPISSTSKSATIQGVTFVDNRDGSYTFYTGENGASATATFRIISKIDGGSPQHVHYLKGNAEGSSISTWYLTDQYNGVFDYDFKEENIVKVLIDTPARLDLRVVVASGTVISAPVTIKPQVIDLTAYFGSSIADYIYNLETVTTGAGVAKLKEWGFFTGEYIPYNAGTLESVEARSHVLTGKNIFGGLKMAHDIVDTVPNATLNETDKTVSYSAAYITGKTLYKFLEPNTQYTIIVQGYNAASGAQATNLAIRYEDGFVEGLSPFVDGVSITVTRASRKVESLVGIWATGGTALYYEKCGVFRGVLDANQFEPYVSHTYDLGTDTLRGLFKLDSNNNLYADGDRKTSDGVIQRKYGVRVYQSGDESLADAITDGTNTVYKLATPTTEQSTPFTNPQICDPDGTEEYVTSNGVPVGHETRYQL